MRTELGLQTRLHVKVESEAEVKVEAKPENEVEAEAFALTFPCPSLLLCRQSGRAVEDRVRVHARTVAPAWDTIPIENNWVMSRAQGKP